MMRYVLYTAAILLFSFTAAAAPAKKAERLTEKTLLNGDRIFRYSPEKPWSGDKHKIFCCPVRKIVRRTSGQKKWIDYCYNAREELIGRRSGNHSGSVKHSDFVSSGTCTQCGGIRKMQVRKWRHNHHPKLAPPKRRSKK